MWARARQRRFLVANIQPMMTAAQEWAHYLAQWAIPDEILAQASESPWIHPPTLFDVPEVIEATPSHQRAREVLDDSATVLDVGCGGGIAAFALCPPATSVMGVDHQPEMLEMFRANAKARDVTVQTQLGDWPQVAPLVPHADVVTAHHVAYNVADVVPFLRALGEHARHRVVLELPQAHPLAGLSEAWRHFWQLERPTTPTAHDLMAVLREMGVDASMELWSGLTRVEHDEVMAAHYNRIRLCLAPEREHEVLEFLRENPAPGTRELATIWWDV